MTFLPILRVAETLSSFRLVLEWKIGKDIPESSRLEFQEKFSAHNFALSNAEDNTSRQLNRGGIVDLPLLGTLLAIHQKFWEPCFCEVIESLLAYASLAASRTLFQWLLACLNFTLDSEDLFYELWQQHKQLKTMEMSETWPDIYDKRCIHQTSLNLLTKLTSSSRSTEFKGILP